MSLRCQLDSIGYKGCSAAIAVAVTCWSEGVFLSRVSRLDRVSSLSSEPVPPASFPQPLCAVTTTCGPVPAPVVPADVEVHNLWCLPQEDACQDFAISCTA